MICPRCQHEDNPRDAEGNVVDPMTCVVRCDECGARIAYGELMPRICVSATRGVVTVSDGDVTHVLDPDEALLVYRAVRHGKTLDVRSPVALAHANIDARWCNVTIGTSAWRIDRDYAVLLAQALKSVADPSLVDG